MASSHFTATNQAVICYTPFTMSNIPIPIDIKSISSNKDLLRLAEEVKETKTPRVLIKDDETLAVLMPVGAVSTSESDIFVELSQNETFIHEAEEAKKQLANNPSLFTNLTEKYSHLIKTNK
jgi:hypothetical protein